MQLDYAKIATSTTTTAGSEKRARAKTIKWRKRAIRRNTPKWECNANISLLLADNPESVFFD
jgi:hypothetical protein